MELKENSFIAKYYKFMFNGHLPMDFCTLFWNTLLSIILFPIAILAINPISREEFWKYKPLAIKTLGGILAYIAILGIGVTGGVILEGYFGKEFVNSMHIVFIILLGFITAIIHVLVLGLAPLGIIYLSEYLWKSRPRRNKYISFERKQPSKIKIVWGTIRNKYCTKINWK